jgi:cytochrome c peroxidase
MSRWRLPDGCAGMAENYKRSRSHRRRDGYVCNPAPLDEIHLKRHTRIEAARTAIGSQMLSSRLADTANAVAVPPFQRPADGPRDLEHPRSRPNGTHPVGSFRIRAAVALATWAATLILGAALFKSSAHDRQPAGSPFAPLPERIEVDVGEVALGRSLFFDRRLSRSRKLSCATCHDLGASGASAAKADRGDTGQVAKWNTPTVFNSVYNFRQGWEGRSRSLRDFTLLTLSAQHLMGSEGVAARRLAADPEMSARFRRVFHASPSDAAVASALTSFMGTLVTTNAPFDRWLRGDAAAMTPRQLRGFARFKVLGCASCHQGVNVGANIFQQRGVFHPLGKPDPKYLRVPGLRNVAVTAPYFHDGRVATLPEAIRQMARAQLDLTIDKRDAEDIAAFLDTLTGEYGGKRLRPAVPARPA